MTEEELAALSYKDLQATCKDMHLPSSGKKADLIARILSLLQKETSLEIVTDINPKNSMIPPLKQQSFSESEKLELRTRRFGSVSMPAAPTGSDNLVDNDEFEKRRLRAIRFGIPTNKPI